MKYTKEQRIFLIKHRWPIYLLVTISVIALLGFSAVLLHAVKDPGAYLALFIGLGVISALSARVSLLFDDKYEFALPRLWIECGLMPAAYPKDEVEIKWWKDNAQFLINEQAGAFLATCAEQESWTALKSVAEETLKIFEEKFQVPLLPREIVPALNMTRTKRASWKKLISSFHGKENEATLLVEIRRKHLDTLLTLFQRMKVTPDIDRGMLLEALKKSDQFQKESSLVCKGVEFNADTLARGLNLMLQIK